VQATKRGVVGRRIVKCQVLILSAPDDRTKDRLEKLIYDLELQRGAAAE
jgi:hypothetical protein